MVAQPGSALAWGARGRWFESSPPDFKGPEFSGLFFSPIAHPAMGGRVAGSNPVHPTKKKLDSQPVGLFSFEKLLTRKWPFTIKLGQEWVRKIQKDL